ncbi:MAG: hypothetical protein GEU74_16700 [Nitriliruptorales bacterium]|nr:hypothetical protein [Nitriliruptorales bacterium]
MRSHLGAVAKHALAAAAHVLGGDDPDAVHTNFGWWRQTGQRELPWLAGPGLSALTELGVPPPAGDDVRVLQRFLVGAEADPRTVNVAFERDTQTAARPGPSVPPDARAALVATVERYFALLVEAYAELHQPIVAGDRQSAEVVCERWRTRLDDAARKIEERGQVVLGLRRPVAARSGPARQTHDHPGWAVGFVVLAVCIAALLLWAVSQGWAMDSVDFGI